MIRFYSPDIEETNTLPEDESGHAIRVLRLREGSEIETIDGAGHAYHCRIVEAHPKRTVVEIIDKRSEPLTWKGKLTLAVAPTKNSERMEWLVEKAVEMGVDEIVLIKCDHSERKNQKIDRLRRIMVSAMKQSLKAVMPRLEEMIGFKEFINSRFNDNSVKVFGYCSDEVCRRDFSSVYDKGGNLTVMIGPEGDFSPEEVAYCMQRGFVPVTFGKSRLRTETAAIYAVTAFHIIENFSDNQNHC